MYMKMYMFSKNMANLSALGCRIIDLFIVRASESGQLTATVKRDMKKLKIRVVVYIIVIINDYQKPIATDIPCKTTKAIGAE